MVTTRKKSTEMWCLRCLFSTSRLTKPTALLSAMESPTPSSSRSTPTPASWSPPTRTHPVRRPLSAGSLNMVVCDSCKWNQLSHGIALEIVQGFTGWNRREQQGHWQGSLGRGGTPRICVSWRARPDDKSGWHLLIP